MKKIFALILSILMLSSMIIVTASAEEVVDWEALTYAHGLNVYVGAPIETPPVIDGVISEGEYSCQRVTLRESMIEQEAVEEIQSDLTEYFAYDDKYVYIGATFEQEQDNRAYWFHFRPLNSFDVYLTIEGAIDKYGSSTGSLIKYYYANEDVQFRYLSDGTLTYYHYPSSLPDSGFNTNLWIGDSEECGLMCVATKNTDEQAKIYTKTYEMRISKAYIAVCAVCEIDEVRVIPYWTWFHAVLWHAAPLTEEFSAALLEANADAYIPEDEGTYWFLVLDENPYPYPPGVTEPPVTEATTTEEVTAEAPTSEATTAPETTAIATTAAPTTAAIATTAAPTTAAAEQGCKSSLALGTVALVPAIICGVVFKKKED